MNIFVLHDQPDISAQMMCNKYIVKMITEGNQMLCNCFNQNLVPYKRTHYNHPCSIWTRHSTANYNWLYFHTKALCEEYTRRYGKIHKGQTVLENLPYYKNDNQEFTDFIQAMPEQYKSRCAVTSYRNYYLHEKLHFCKWPVDRIPEFVKNYCLQNNIDILEYISK